MHDDNRITGPGYYPRRPTRGHSFEGVPFRIHVIKPNGDHWDSVGWFGSGEYSVECVIRPSTVAGISVEDVNYQVIYRHMFAKPVDLALGERVTFTLNNKTPPRANISRPEHRWVVP